MEIFRKFSPKAVLIAVLFLSACTGATAVPTSTAVPVSTEAPTAAATDTAEATATTEAAASETPMATAEMTGTVEVTGTAEATGTVEVTGTTEVNATSEPTGTVMATVEATSTSVMTGTVSPGGNLAETLAASNQYSTLVRALTASGLLDQLKEQGPFTLFVPSEEAFAKMSADSLTSLLSDTTRLSNVLKYHLVVGSKLMAADLANETSVKTLNGADLRVSVKDGVVYVDDAKVVQSDIVASNGVIHVIDSVLTPPTQ